MTTTSNGNALAVREYTDNQIKQRMSLNAKAGYGLEKASQAQLNIIFQMCQRYSLDPVSDITLFENRPFITIDGRLRLLRRHPEYRGYTCRPLSKDEKDAWGYEPADIVVECIIRTTTWGEISARGKVTAVEVQSARERAERDRKRPAPIGVHPVEIAEKRAIARAERAAFGQDAVLEEDDAELVIEERNDPARIARDAKRYTEIFPDEAEPVREAPVDPLEQALLQHGSLLDMAQQIGVKGLRAVTAEEGDGLARVLNLNRELEQRIRSRNSDLDQQAVLEQAER